MKAMDRFKMRMEQQKGKQRTANAVNEDLIRDIKTKCGVELQTTSLEQLLKLISLIQVARITIKHETVLLDELVGIDGSSDETQNRGVVDKLSSLKSRLDSLANLSLICNRLANDRISES